MKRKITIGGSLLYGDVIVSFATPSARLVGHSAPSLISPEVGPSPDPARPPRQSGAPPAESSRAKLSPTVASQAALSESTVIQCAGVLRRSQPRSAPTGTRP